MASQWLPEDDFLLRKSIEDGACIETLAKGAVRFSKKFTLSELTDRWHCLLYNPNVTSLSSSVGFELQYSSQFLPQGNYQSIPVRTQYYASRKRMRLEQPLNVHNNAIDELLNEEEGTAFGEYDDDFGFMVEDIDRFHKTYQDDDQQDEFQTTMVGNDNDNDDGMVDLLLNINDELIQDGNVVTDTTIDHVLLQEPLFQQPNEQVISDQAQTWIDQESYQDFPSKEEEHRRRAMLLSELDPHPEIINGVINCTINQEFDEIPDNDHIILQMPNPKARNSSNNPSSSSLKKHMKPPLPPTRGSQSSSQAKRNNIVHGFGDCNVPIQASSSSSAFKDSFTEKVASSVAEITSSSQLSPEIEICLQTLSAEMELNDSMPQEEDNNDEIESDEDLPSYSELEAMILDMELEPIGQDRFELEASRYRNNDMARKLMRLEQSAESYMNRDMASRGAFALLYGSSKHYINKPEVLLGRATGEYPVDIDLGSSGSETRFSRRQALIRLKQDGCFEIKNLGKFSIWMNDEEIDHGEVVTLKNSCLIQIREKSFIFETNEKEVKRYLKG
ncbi:hypothetical protein V5N11_013876 [Cardamine amara subsp. amara]|uniref:FHA domain-containing protein n=1 Tax=Cardamine amara subsp. amara TaxID=228776 RepID=A0ABD1A069_CARAN